MRFISILKRLIKWYGSDVSKAIINTLMVYTTHKDGYTTYKNNLGLFTIALLACVVFMGL